MVTVTYSSLRENLKNFMDQAIQDHVSFLVTRKSGENVVLLSESDYNSLRETAYLLRSPKNARRLLESLRDSNKASGKEFTMNDLENLE
ncbi:MAG: type II toxin-antitoxin system prevent-host-death family antitoxin [Alphaproteobacteria bacterium]|jgi:antitoxin YefM|nr:type II toxin-antitoxin system prevent-host-death family antitoxin [Alphaproteobacteria bacterium]MBT5390123.1 type II toxin-antitoxin system prevent-host-death family antitoxin [Alphaproteobacteria bacterium]MBT5540886.1 type II toxin-antitoxin system prevent-host-death family antitoxin [Alphaproteobacteria bacterium]MBT5654756.1 type II toxin-antitoxin system prevent-host-death family antitoxin [Alphaproteobacteria bacterium]